MEDFSVYIDNRSRRFNEVFWEIFAKMLMNDSTLEMVCAKLAWRTIYRCRYERRGIILSFVFTVLAIVNCFFRFPVYYTGTPEMMALTAIYMLMFFCMMQINTIVFNYVSPDVSANEKKYFDDALIFAVRKAEKNLNESDENNFIEEEDYESDIF